MVKRIDFDNIEHERDYLFKTKEGLYFVGQKMPYCKGKTAIKSSCNTVTGWDREAENCTNHVVCFYDLPE